MTHTALAQSIGLGFQTQQPLEWLFVAGALVLLGGVIVLLIRAGAAGQARGLRDLIVRAGSGVERATSLPAWSGAGVLLGSWALLVAFIGFMWDVAWHTDLGRDRVLFTVPHTLILIGLMGIGAAAVASTLYATLQRADAGWRVRGLRVPAGAAVLLALSVAALVGFPLDDLWHRTYGIDVTMWSPTHLLMIGAASLAPLAIAMLLWEAPRVADWRRRSREAVTCGAILVGLSSFQLEFDMGVPQWQELYQPALIAAATGFGLVLARSLLGRWGALRAAVVFLVLRGGISLLVGPLLGHTTPHIPLYLGEALCVEIAFALASRPLLRTLLAGGLIGTAGLATEWGWTWVWSAQPWQLSMLPHLWVAVLAAVAAALLGWWFAGALRKDVRAPRTALPAWAAPAALAALIALLIIPLPRDRSAAVVLISASPVGAEQTVTDRNGVTAHVRHASVDVQVTPAGAVQGADWFRVTAWQGGAVVNIPLRQVGPGLYRAAQPVPFGGDWKSMVYLGKGAVLAAAPLAFPAEPDLGLQAIAFVPHRTASLDAAQRLLIRESHGGSPIVADIAYAVFALTVCVWLLALSAGARRLSRSGAGRDAVERTVSVEGTLRRRRDVATVAPSPPL